MFVFVQSKTTFNANSRCFLNKKSNWKNCNRIPMKKKYFHCNLNKSAFKGQLVRCCIKWGFIIFSFFQYFKTWIIDFDLKSVFHLFIVEVFYTLFFDIKIWMKKWVDAHCITWIQLYYPASNLSVINYHIRWKVMRLSMYAEAKCIFHVSTLSTCRKIYDQFHGIMLIDWNILVDRIIYISIA